MATTVHPERSRGTTPQRRDSAPRLFLLVVLAGVALLAVGWAASTSNRLVRADQEVRARWSQVRTVDQRRAELVPGLVEIVQTALQGESAILLEVGDARAQVDQLSRTALVNALENPAEFHRYGDTQRHLSAALGRLLALDQVHPELASTAAFRDLRAQLEGTEERAALERTRFNEAARAFNLLARRFPASLVARSLGATFAPKPLFEVTPEVHDAPAARL